MYDFLSMDEYCDHEFKTYEEFLIDSDNRYRSSNCFGRKRCPEKFSNDPEVKARFKAKRLYWMKYFAKQNNFSGKKKNAGPKKIKAYVSKLVGVTYVNGCKVEHYKDVEEVIDLKGDVIAF